MRVRILLPAPYSHIAQLAERRDYLRRHRFKSGWSFPPAVEREKPRGAVPHKNSLTRLEPLVSGTSKGRGFPKGVKSFALHGRHFDLVTRCGSISEAVIPQHSGGGACDRCTLPLCVHIAERVLVLLRDSYFRLRRFDSGLCYHTRHRFVLSFLSRSGAVGSRSAQCHCCGSVWNDGRQIRAGNEAISRQPNRP